MLSAAGSGRWCGRPCVHAVLGSTQAAGRFDMKKLQKAQRALCMVAVGACMLQATGCVAGLAPAFASYLESALVSYLLGGLFY